MRPLNVMPKAISNPIFMLACLLVSALALPCLTFAARYTVSKDAAAGGTYRTISEALRAAARDAGKQAVVEILDQAVYPEQLLIDSAHAGLTLKSSQPASARKPVIRWQDKAHLGPRSYEESRQADKIDFDSNGTVRVMQTRDVTLEGLTIDGGSPHAEGFDKVWAGTGYHFFGNVGLNLNKSLSVTIRHCDIQGAFYGVYFKDRNEGGIYGNANPGDLRPDGVVPLSAFGQAGNHLVERNRIHGNVWGLHFESNWDLSATIRYNLFYQNRHPSKEFEKALFDKYGTAPKVGGQDHPGGAILFKDILLTPLAIYNNTFWHNRTVFFGTWQVGGHHLVFNNIYGAPSQYLGKPSYISTWNRMDHVFVNRMKHCTWAAQYDSVRFRTESFRIEAYDDSLKRNVRDSVTLTLFNGDRAILGGEGFNQLTTESKEVELVLRLSGGKTQRQNHTINEYIGPGALISHNDPAKAYPASANVRWLEQPFKSTDPASPDFLVPDWDDPAVLRYVKDAGWPAAGMLDADGSPADLGAIPSGGMPSDVALIKAQAPVLIQGDQATLSFILTTAGGRFDNPKIKYFRMVQDVPYLKDNNGHDLKPLPEATELPVPGNALRAGSNTFTVNIPPRSDTSRYAFFEMVLEGTGTGGQAVTSNVGFLPYRKLDYKFLVEVWDAAGAKKLDTVKAGIPVMLKITPQTLAGHTFSNAIKPVEVRLNSGVPLVNGSDLDSRFAIADGIRGPRQELVVFTKVPEGGLEIVTVSGLWTENGKTLGFFGSSGGVKVLPGPAEKVRFVEPASKQPGVKPTILDPDQKGAIALQAYDRFDNATAEPAEATVKSAQPEVGDMDGSGTSATDSTGLARFRARITKGNTGDVFEIQASLAGNGPVSGDTAEFEVGRYRARYWILYSDISGYDPKARLEGEVGTRRKAIIRVSEDGKARIDSIGGGFSVLFNGGGLQAYASETGGNPASEFQLEAGEAVLWVTGALPVDNASIQVVPGQGTPIPGNRRDGIFFHRTLPKVLAGYYTDVEAPWGEVDAAVVRFDKRVEDLAGLKIEISFAGADAAVAGARLAMGVDSLELALDLAGAFQHSIAKKTSGEMKVKVVFGGVGGGVREGILADSAAPVVSEASLKLAEAPGEGDDTLVVRFSEPVIEATWTNEALLVKKRGGSDLLPMPTEKREAAVASGEVWRVIFPSIEARAGQAHPYVRDSVRIAQGSLRDAGGNSPGAHTHLEPVAGKARPPRLYWSWEKPVVELARSPGASEFLILAPGTGGSWAPMQGGRHGQTHPCAGADCGSVEADPDGKLRLPNILIEADTAFTYAVKLFNNLGEYVNALAGKVEAATLTGNPATGNSKYRVRIAWTGLTRGGAHAATGAYVAKVEVVTPTEDAEGRPALLRRAKVLRFGLVRGGG